MRLRRSVVIFLGILLAPSLCAFVIAADEAYRLQVHQSGRLASLQIPQQEYAYLNDPLTSLKANVKRRISNFLYGQFDDDFDFIMLLSNTSSRPAGMYYGRHTCIKNEVEGLGLDLAENTALHGSSGRLRGIIHFTARNFLKNGFALVNLFTLN